MNKYGQAARDHWLATAPARVAAIGDPETYFSELGMRILLRVDALMCMIDQPVPREGERFLQRVARLASVRRLAEEYAYYELVAPDEEHPLRSDMSIY